MIVPPTVVADLKISFTRFAPIALFTMLFPLDAMLYVVSSVYGVNKVPMGALAGAAGFLLIARYLLFYRYQRYFAAIALVMAAAVATASGSRYYDLSWVPLFGWYLAMFTIGYGLGGSESLKNSPASWLIIAATVLCALVTIYAMIGHIPPTPEPDERFNYLRPAMSLMVAGILSMYLAKMFAVRLALYLVIAVALAMLTSRTFFFVWATLPAIAVFSEFVAGRSFRRKFLALFVGPLLLTISAAFLFLFVLPMFQDSLAARMLPSINLENGQVVSDDNSIRVRYSLFLEGIGQIADNPISGYYKGYLDYGIEGSYIHNILSYWHQFGVVPFAALLLLIVHVFFQLLRSNAQFVRCGMTLFIASVGTMVLSRSYVSTELFFVLGYGLTAAVRDSHPSHKANRDALLASGTVTS